MRLQKELKDAQREKSGDLVLEPRSEKDIFKWDAYLKGPAGSPFEGGVFHVPIDIPSEYPLAPPKARFKTKVFHPNIHPRTGEICLDVLKEAWSPAWTLQALCRAILALLSNSEPDSPLNCDAGNLVRESDLRGYLSCVRMYVKEYAQHSVDELRRSRSS